MFARKISIWSDIGGGVKLVLLMSALYLPLALAQDPVVNDSVEPVEAAVDDGTIDDSSADESLVGDGSVGVPPREGTGDTPAEGPVVETLPENAPAESRHIERFGSGSTEEWEMDLSVPTPAPTQVRKATPAYFLPDPAQNQELQSLLISLADNPDDPKVMAQLNVLLNKALGQMNSDLDVGLLDEASQLGLAIQSIKPDLPGLTAAQQRLRLMSESARLVASGTAALQANHVIQPENDNAYYYFTEAKKKDPKNSAIEVGLARVQAALIARAYTAADGLDFELAEQWLGLAEDVRENRMLVDQARAQIAAAQSGRAEELTAKVNAAIEERDFNMADFLIIDLIAMGGQEDKVATLRAALKDARYYSGFQPGQTFSDPFLDGSDKAPEVVVVPSGSFMMGSDGSYDNESPRHRVSIERGFGIGVREVTVSEFRLFILKSGYRTVAEIGGSSKIYNESVGRLSSRDNVTWLDAYNGDRAGLNSPVVHVSWHDAKAYVDWLSQETGKRYRLPTEIEYEYVARAGGSSDYWWGDGTPSEAVENLTGEKDESPGDRQWTTFFDDYKDGYWGPAPVGSLKGQNLIHPFGVSDIAGNVSEWVEDCWHPNYMQAPETNKAWVNLGCERRVARGGYWASAPSGSRAAYRISANPNTVGPVVGIRIARDL